MTNRYQILDKDGYVVASYCHQRQFNSAVARLKKQHGGAPHEGKRQARFPLHVAALRRSLQC